MELRRLRRHVINRGGLTEAWLVYAEERDPGPAPVRGGLPRPRLLRAFWTLAEATEWARAEESSQPSRRFDVYRIALDERWVSDNSLRAAHHVSPNDTAPRPSVTVTPGAIAHAFG